jgi:LPXTG-motif cell wall-anchored protein
MGGDGCTLWFDGDWGRCCQLHDIAYSIGIDKGIADIHLASCVAQTGHPAIALLMLLGVTLGGWAFYRKKRRH